MLFVWLAVLVCFKIIGLINNLLIIFFLYKFFLFGNKKVLINIIIVIKIAVLIMYVLVKLNVFSFLFVYFLINGENIMFLIVLLNFILLIKLLILLAVIVVYRIIIRFDFIKSGIVSKKRNKSMLVKWIKLNAVVDNWLNFEKIVILWWVIDLKLIIL